MCCCVVLCVSVVVSQCSDIYIFLRIQNRRAEHMEQWEEDSHKTSNPVDQKKMSKGPVNHTKK